MIRKLLILISFLMLVLPGSADVLYAESGLFAGSASTSETIPTSGSADSTNYAAPYRILDFYNNFDTIKIIDKYTFGNGFQNSAYHWTLTSSANGMNELFVPFTSTVSGTNYGSGVIGWRRTTGNNFQFIIDYVTVNTAYAQTLSGNLEIVLTYDTSVYGSYLADDYSAGGNGHYVGTWSYGYIDVTVNNDAGKYVREPATGTVYAQSSYSENFNFSVANISTDYAYLYVTKNTNNFRIVLSNATVTIYDVTSTSNVAILFEFLGTNYLGIYSLNDGSWVNRTLVNGAVVQPTPTATVALNPITNAGLQFNKNNYTKDEIATISYRIDPSIFNPVSRYAIIITKDNVEKDRFENLDMTTREGNVQKKLTEVGTYTARLEACIILCITMDEKSAYVSLNPSYIFITSPVIAGASFNASYIYGNVVQVQGDLNTVVIERITNTGFMPYRSVSIGNNNVVQGISYNVSMIVGQPGEYKASLVDSSRGRIASTIFSAIGGFVPIQKNITTSFVLSDKSNYFFGEAIKINYGIDNTNYSNGSLQKYIQIRNTDLDLMNKISLNSYIEVTEQEDVLGLSISNEMTGNCLDCYIVTNAIYYAGNNIIELVAKSGNITTVLASKPITISKINTEGYGLDVSKSKICTKETVFIEAYSPGTATIEVYLTSKTVQTTLIDQINFSVNKSFQYKFGFVGTYRFILKDASGKTQFNRYVDVNECAVVTAVAPTKPTSAESTLYFVGSSMFFAIIILLVFLGMGAALAGHAGMITAGAMVIPIMYLAPGDFDVSPGSPGGHMIPGWTVLLLAALVFIMIAVFASTKLTKINE